MDLKKKKKNGYVESGLKLDFWKIITIFKYT